jgi:EAL domain-containing protein (putative c-di-GMP-specific phosphodiesterase class I)
VLWFRYSSLANCRLPNRVLQGQTASDSSVHILVKTLANAVQKQKEFLVADSLLIVDDNPLVLRWMRRSLENGPLSIISCASPREALRHVANGNIRVVVSDISMPEMSGLELLQSIREIDPDLPVILLTGVPSIDSAASAVEYGAFMYLLKPVTPDVLVIAIERADRFYRIAQCRRESLSSLGVTNEASQLATLECAFEESLSSLWLAFQPIVKFSDGSAFAYEALLRSDNAALNGPEAILHAAERLGALNKLGRAIRGLAADSLKALPDEVTLFVNLHPQDLMDPQLLDGQSNLSLIAPRIVLEITERCGLSKIDDLAARVRKLRRMGFRIAVDDLGAGYSGLANVALLEPEFIKLDMALVRDIDQSSVKQKLVSSLVRLSKAMGHSLIAEGIETQAECDTLVGLECDLLQGYLFAKPTRTLPTFEHDESPPSVEQHLRSGEYSAQHAPESQKRIIAAKRA